jgi:hypothetical protein
MKLQAGLYRTFLSFVWDYGFNLVNHAAASPWLRCSWSPNYSVLVIILEYPFFLCVFPPIKLFFQICITFVRVGFGRVYNPSKAG